MCERAVFRWLCCFLFLAGCSGETGLQAADAATDANFELDSDGDGLFDSVERSLGMTLDTDSDGREDYLDADDDGDGLPTRDELNRDTDRDGIPDRLDTDDDGDGVLTKDELANGAAVDSDGNGVPDYLQPKPAEPIDAGTIKECAQSNTKADLRKKPVDIVFIIDNSSSMASEIQSVQASVNESFAKIIAESGVDYRVIMLADFGYFDGGARSICVTGGLNPSQSCPANASDAVYASAPKLNAPHFYHYDADGNKHNKATTVGSLNSLCRALEWYSKPDGFKLAPQGWGQWLRKDAFKVFVEISDDRADCSADLNGDGTADVQFDDTKDDPQDAKDVPGEWQAKTFDKALRMLSSDQFGTDTERNYVWHSIISLPDKPAATMNEPYTSADPIKAANCSSGENPGRAYEALSRMTDGLRFPICAADAAIGKGDLSGFNAVFKRIALGVVEGSKVACDFGMPQAPAGATLDRSTVEVVYTPGSADMQPVSFREVADKDHCGTQSSDFYYDKDRILLCATACSRVQADTRAAVDVRFGCTLPPRVPPPPAVPIGPDLQ
jgi:hypothetical protein